MSQPIFTQNLSVWYKQDPITRREGINFRLHPVNPDLPISPDVTRTCDWGRVQRCVQRIQSQVHDLLGRAVFGVEREESGIERPAHDLSLEILPPGGFVGLLDPGVHPMLDVENDEMGRIPWEALEELYHVCPKGECRTDPLGQQTAFCQTHGCAMVSAGGKLALSHHLAYLVRGKGRATGRGKRFLIVEDPRGDMSELRGDRRASVREHFAKLRDLLTGQGYEVCTLAQSAATCDRVLQTIASPDLMGIYYFGHGRLPTGSRGGCLVLADGELGATEIDEHAPTARFVFLNACEAGALPAPTGQEMERPLSLASAFAKGGGGRVVIAPFWPIVRDSAASFALTFFEKACQGSVPLAECLRLAREASFRQYEGGRPDACWLSYRYFGDPNRTLGLPTQKATDLSGAHGRTGRTERVFRDDQRLCTEAFGFAIDDVLLRAAKRRNSQNRKRITNGDLIAGLVRKGELTRYALQESGLDPDAIYQPIVDHLDEGREPSDRKWDGEGNPPAGEGGGKSDAEESLRRFAAMFIIRDRDDFDPEVVEILSRADSTSLARHQGVASPPISEEDLLVNLFAVPQWRELTALGLPPRERIEGALRKRQGDGLDENGFVCLDRLDASAKRVIQAAHTLAQQRGVFPITHRVLLAALLAEPNGYAAQVCRAAHTPIRPEVLCQIMRALIEEEDAQTFGLSRKACEKIVTPVLREAERLVSSSAQATEKHLFVAFCEVAVPGFKSLLRRHPLCVDLDHLKMLRPPDEVFSSGLPGSDGKALSAVSGADGRDASGAAQAEPADGRAQRSGDVLSGMDLHGTDFEPAAWQVVMRAEAIARAAKRPVVNSPHLFAAMVDASDGMLATFLAQHPGNRENLKRVALSLLRSRDTGLADTQELSWSENGQMILHRAREIAQASGRAQICNDDLVASFFADGGGVIGQLLVATGLEAIVRSVPVSSSGVMRSPSGGDTQILDQLGVDLTEMARKGQLPAVVGRDREIESTIQSLMLSESANPLLVGEAGVGKTAIAGGIAQRIVEGRCPQKLKSCKIFEISAGSLVADTSLRGEFEKRLQQLLSEIKGKGIILFIDEIHTIVGTGAGGSGHLDAGNMLKAAMARGEIRIIGATTPPECRQTIERDKALARRFQKILVRPPSREATIQMLSSTRQRLEQYHETSISDAAIAAAVDLSGRYVHDKQWPAKARDVLDRACVVSASGPVEFPALQVLPEHVTQVIASVTGLPLQQISASDLASLATLEERVRRRIIGQDAAIHAVAEAIRRGRMGLAVADRPWGVFLFVGPPGVGKTELAKSLADEVYGYPDGLIRFDMGDFTEPHSTARLVGSPPGYVGYDRGAPLVEKLRANPYSLLLFDEIEQAHVNVLATLLRLFSEGTITDSDGNTADARNSIVILTSNILGRSKTNIGFGTSDNAGRSEVTDASVRSALLRHLPRNLLDRVDATILFNPLDAPALVAIADPAIWDIVGRIGEKYRLLFDVDPSVAVWLVENVAASGSGARDIQREIEQHISAPLVEFAESHADQHGPFLISVQEGRFHVGPVTHGG